MTASYLDLAASLAEHFPEVEAPRLARAAAFRVAVDRALAVVSAEALVREVVAEGGLRGAANPYGVLIARLRRAPDHVTEAARLVEDDAEARRWRLVDKAAKRGETLRALVARGDLRPEEASEQLAADFRDDADLFSIAKAALLGGSP